MWKDDATAADILLAAQDIQQFAAATTRENFASDKFVQSAVIFKIIVLGEAAKRLSDEFRRKHPQINWKQVAGMRDRCVHGYDDIDVDIVWLGEAGRIFEEHYSSTAQWIVART